MALLAMGVAGDEVLFVDDQMRNVDGAVRAGLEAQFFDVGDVSGTIEAIRKRVGLESEGIVLATQQK